MAHKYGRSDDLLDISVYEGKYTVIQRSSGELFFLRHKEPWDAANNDDSLRFSGMILALAQEIQDFRKMDES